MKQLFALSIAMLLSVFFTNTLSAQTTPKNCNPENCAKICQVICGKTAATKTAATSCTAKAKATTVAMEAQEGAKNPICSKICSPQACAKGAKSVKQDDTDASNWVLTVGLPTGESKEQPKKTSCVKTCKAKAKVASF